MISLDIDEAVSARVTLYHQVQLSYDGNEWEQLWAYVGTPSAAHVAAVETYLNPGDWKDDEWSCYAIGKSTVDGATTFDTLGLESDHVSSVALSSPERPVSQYTLRPGTARVAANAPEMSEEFAISADANTSGVGCRRTGELSPSVGGGRRLFQPTTLIIKDASGDEVIANATELVAFPGEWDPGAYWATADGSSTVAWESGDLDGTTEIAEDTDVLGIAWNEGWFLDSRLSQQNERLAWFGALLIGAGLGAILALLAPPARHGQ